MAVGTGTAILASAAIAAGTKIVDETLISGPARERSQAALLDQRREEQRMRQEAAQTAKARKERVMARRAQRGQRSRRAGTQAADAGGLSLDRVIGGTSDTIG